jgi:flagellar basal-body rod protein FlgF
MQAPSLILLSNQQALQRTMDIVANNVANASTTGFKREGIEFDTYVSRPAAGQTLNFVVDRATYRDASTGPIQPTGNPLDLAIQGKGYFAVRAADGTTKYTRGGSLSVDAQGEIVTQSGLPVLSDGNQPITLPDTSTDVNVAGDGFVTVRVDNGVNLAQLGKIGVVQFDNEQGLQSEGNGIYSTTQVSAPATDSSIVQGSLEQSNVQPVTEMTQMIKIMHSYEQTSNLISQENGRLTDAINRLSKTTA